ncbi:MAG: hypothetical protein ABIS51_17585 [Sphingomonas sp.]
MSFTPTESNPAEMQPNAGAPPAQPSARDAADPVSPAADPNATALVSPPSTAAADRESARTESLSDFIERLRFEHGPATPPAPAPAPTPRTGGNLMMRLWSQMEPDLELQTGGKRVATYEEIHESLHNAARAEGITLPALATGTSSGQQEQPIGRLALNGSSGQAASATSWESSQPLPDAKPASSGVAAPAAGGVGGNLASSPPPAKLDDAVPPESAQPGTPDIIVKGDPAETAYAQSLNDDEFARYREMQSWLDGLEPSATNAGTAATPKTQPAAASSANPAAVPKTSRAPAQKPSQVTDDVGVLSRRYESSSRDASTISRAAGDAGGKSYGSYQLASAKGQVAAFLKAEGKRWAPEFNGMKLHEQPFDDQWRVIAKRDRTAFLDAQTAYIRRTHYDPVAAEILRVRGVDINTLSNAVQNAVLSVATQMGPGQLAVNGKGKESGASLIVSRAVWRTTLDPKDPDYEKQLIDKIYGARTQYAYRVKARDIQLSNDPKKSPNERKEWAKRAVNMQAVIDHRYPSEQADAQQMLANEQARQKP